MQPETTAKAGSQRTECAARKPDHKSHGSRAAAWNVLVCELCPVKKPEKAKKMPAKTAATRLCNRSRASKYAPARATKACSAISHSIARGVTPSRKKGQFSGYQATTCGSARHGITENK